MHIIGNVKVHCNGTTKHVFMYKDTFKNIDFQRSYGSFCPGNVSPINIDTRQDMPDMSLFD